MSFLVLQTSTSARLEPTFVETGLARIILVVTGVSVGEDTVMMTPLDYA